MFVKKTNRANLGKLISVRLNLVEIRSVKFPTAVEGLFTPRINKENNCQCDAGKAVNLENRKQKSVRNKESECRV